MKRLLYIIAVLFILSVTNTLSQQGLKFAELAQRLDPYFAKELIGDIKKQLPQGSDYSIWGWDVGDFSGDGYFDVALTVRLAGEKKRTVQVYLFVDLDGFLNRVGQFTYEFVDLPLEIGCVIRYNACFITKKQKQFNWLIRGYRFDNGSLIVLDEYTTTKLEYLTHESYTNYQSLNNTEKYLKTGNGEQKFFAKFLRIPSYQRGRQIYHGYHSEAYTDDIDFVPKGAYWWEGDKDASFWVRSAYDQQYLYMTIRIKDDKIVVQKCDTCICDYVELWFDALPPYIESGDRFVIDKKDKGLKFRTNAEIGIFRFGFYPGDFLEKKSYVKIGTTDDLESQQKLSARNIKVSSTLQEEGFTIKFKIPFTILGFEENPLTEEKPVELGCTVVYHDFDNEFRPEEETELATSAFSSMNPATYGSLLLIPNEQWYGENINIYKDDIVKVLLDNGF
jgi:hypothetical protein